MERRSRSVWSIALLIIAIVSLIPRVALAMDASPDSSIHAPDCYHADFGDLPDSYHTTRGADGAYHDQGSLRLGASFDWEDNGRPSDNARADDTFGGDDDEDGVVFAPPAQCAGSTLQFTVNVTGGSGTLGAWFDWNQDGDWDPGEGIRQRVVQGANVVTVACPAYFDDKGSLNTRFRLYAGTPSSISAWGGVTNGEVEDYTWTFSPTAVQMVGFTGGAHFTSLQGVASLALVATAVFGLEEIRRRHSRVRAG